MEALRPSLRDPGQKLLWIPFAERLKKMKARGLYSNGYPVGAIIHWTSGSSMSSSMNYGREQGYLFLGIDKAGRVYQTNPLNEWGYHAGESSWPVLGTGVSRFLVGIEIDCAGKLNANNKAWFGRNVPADQVRTVERRQNMHAGNYEKYTPEQEESLKALLLWLKRNNPDVFSLDLVLGHDEVAPSRKTDPGGSLSMTMPEYREMLKKEYLEEA